MTRAALVLVLVAGTAHADRFKMRKTDSTNMHLADQRGATHWRDDITVTVELRADKKLTAVATGTRGTHNYYNDGPGAPYNTDDDTAFTTKWTGTWSAQSGSLVLDLALAGDRCKRARTSDKFPTETLACRTPAKRTRVTCATETVELSDPKRTTEAWICQPAAPEDLGESPAWVLGKTRCIEVLGGHRGLGGMRGC